MHSYSHEAQRVLTVPLITPKAGRSKGRPYTEEPDAMPPDDVIAVIESLSPALRCAPLLAGSTGLRRGEICGLRVGALWLPTRDDRTPMEWYLTGCTSPTRRRKAITKYGRMFAGDRFRHGLVVVNAQRTMVHDFETLKMKEEFLPYVKRNDSYRVEGIPKVLSRYLCWYIDEFLGSFDQLDPSFATQLLLRSMVLDATGHHRVPSVPSVSAAVKGAMKRAGYDIESTGHGCGLHLLRKAHSGWLEALNELSGRTISEHLGHRTRRSKEKDDKKPSAVTARYYMPPVRPKQVLKVTKATNRLLKKSFGSFERFQTSPLRLGDGYVISDEVAERFGNTMSTVDWMARAGRLPAVKTWVAGYAARRWAFERAGVEAHQARRAPDVLAPAGTLSTAETAAALRVTDNQVTLLVRKKRLAAIRTRRGLRIPQESLDAYRAIYCPEGTISFGEALERINRVVSMTSKKLHQLCAQGVIRAHRRPKGNRGYWLRPYIASVDEYLERAAASLDGEAMRRGPSKSPQSGTASARDDLAS